MILSDGAFVGNWRKATWSSSPGNPELQIQPASLEVRLGREFFEFKTSNVPCFQPRSGNMFGKYGTKTNARNPAQLLLSEWANEEEHADRAFEQDEFIHNAGDFLPTIQAPLGTVSDVIGGGKTQVDGVGTVF